MQSVQDIIKKRNIQVTEKVNKKNPVWEEADEIGKRCEIPTSTIMRMIKTHGIEKVRKLVGFLQDHPNITQKPPVGLAYWYLKHKA